MLLYGLNGKRYGITDRIAGGGEGDLYAISGDKYHVIKVYKSPTVQRERKVRAMVQSPLRDSTVLAWPKDVIYDSNGNFRGFLMDRIYGGDPINAIYEIGSRAKYSNAPWSHRVVIAINLCCALKAVHDAGQIIGDFNPKNMFINMRSGHVKLVDTDSYHIHSEGVLYACVVSMANYLAPEIAKRVTGGRTLESLKSPTFTMSSDNFALAIHIYQLLMNGTHPYQGALRPGVDEHLPGIRENILSSTVPSMGACPKHMIPPSYAPSFNSLSPELQTLFRRAFLSDRNRPTPEEWHSALISYRNSLKQCRRNLVHFYYGDLPNCPLCLADAKYQRILGATSSIQRHNPRLMVYQSAVYRDPCNPIASDSLYLVAEGIIQDQSPIDETYLMDLCIKVLPKCGMSRAEVRSFLRESLFHVEDGRFVTYVTSAFEYDNYCQYRSMPDGKRSKSVNHISFLDMRNAMLSVLKDKGAAHITYLISETERRLGLRHGSIKSAHRLNRVAQVLIRSGLILESNDNYRLA